MVSTSSVQRKSKEASSTLERRGSTGNSVVGFVGMDEPVSRFVARLGPVVSTRPFRDARTHPPSSPPAPA